MGTTIDPATRLELLDRLMVLAETSVISDPDMSALVSLLAKMGDTERDAVLSYVAKEDTTERLKRLVRLARMAPDEQGALLKAMGISARGLKGELNEALEFFGQQANESKALLADLATARERLESYLNPLKRLFGKRSEKA